MAAFGDSPACEINPAVIEQCEGREWLVVLVVRARTLICEAVGPSAELSLSHLLVGSCSDLTEQGALTENGLGW